MKKLIPIVLVLFAILHSALAQSLFSDMKAAAVGDVLSVIIAENANASQQSKSSSSSDTDMSLNAAASGNVANFLPVFGGSSSMGSSYKGEDGTQQNDKLTGRISVRIIEVTGNGIFKIKGERKLGVNGTDNIMRLEGFIRSRDITTENTVYSFNVAEAKITYRDGGLTDGFLAKGTTGKIFTWLLGGLMVAAATGYFAFN